MTSTWALPDSTPTLAAATLSATEINLSWNDVANEWAYGLERSLDGLSGWTQILRLPPGTTSFKDTYRTQLTTYYYRIRAIGPCGFATGYSPVVHAATLAAPVAPSSLVAKALSWKNVRLTWLDLSTTESGFVVQRSNRNTFPAIDSFTVGS